MRIELSYLILENFKGVKNFNLQLGGQSAIVTGKNGTGKTTLADSFFWLFSDSNADNKTNFDILFLNGGETGSKRPPAIVECGIFVGSKLIHLKKVFKQNWKKKRGKSKAEFCGHTTDYFINDVPLQKKEYLSKLADIIDPNLFRTLSDIKYFCGTADAEYRRSILLELIGKIEDEKIFEENSELEPLRVTFDGKSYDECKRFLNARKRELERELNHLPIRIDEIKLGLNAIDNDYEIGRKIKSLQSEIAEKRAMLTPDGKEVERMKKIFELETDLHNIVEKRRRDENKLKFKIERLEMSIKSDGNNLDNLGREIERIEGLICKNSDARKALKKRWDEINNSKYESGNRCYACGQLLPSEKMVEMIESFNKDKSEKLKTIDAAGKELFNDFNQLSSQKEKHRKYADELKKIRKETEEKLIAVKSELTELSKSDSTLEIEAEIQKIKSTTVEIDSSDEIKSMEEELNALTKKRLAISMEEEKKARIEKLDIELKAAAREYEKVEQNIFLLSRYVEIKNKYIESMVNQFFALTQWRLFENHLNNGFKNVCEPMFQSVSYGGELNTGAKINVGLDVIKTLSNHYKIELPVWIDNAESVTHYLVETDLQVIKLVASTEYQNLEVINNGEVSHG